jgi:hypothetical protein
MSLWRLLCFLPQGKAKPAARQGRKATGFNETAGLPNKVTRLFYENNKRNNRRNKAVRGGRIMKTLIRGILICLFVFGFTQTSNAQFIEWEATLGVGSTRDAQPTYEIGIDPITGELELVHNGYIAGVMTNNGTDYIPELIKLHSDGSTEWIRSYNNLSTVDIYRSQQTVDLQGNPNGYMIIGKNQKRKPTVLTVDLSGNILNEFVVWPTAYIFIGFPAPSGMQTSDGGTIIAANISNSYVKIWKLGQNGEVENYKDYGEQGSIKRVRSMQETRDGGFVIAGSKCIKTYYGCSPLDTEDFWLLKINSNLVAEWEHTFGSISPSSGAQLQDAAYDVRETYNSEGLADGYIVSGIKVEGSSIYGLVIRTDKYGQEVWRHDLHRVIPVAAGVKVIQTDDQGFIAASIEDRYGTGVFTLVKLDAAGNSLWKETFSSIPASMYSFEGAPDGGMIIGGYSEGYQRVVKISEEGELTEVGQDIEVILPDESGETPVALIFDNITESGTTHLEIKSEGSAGLEGFKVLGTNGLPVYYDITTTATFSGQVEVCIDYSGLSYTKGKEKKLVLGHNNEELDTYRPPDSTPEDPYDTKILCALVSSFSEFVVLEPLNEAPIANAGLDQVVQAIYEDGTTTVTLDASASSDPDGDNLDYSWLKDGIRIATGEVANVIFGLGEHLVTLEVGDGIEFDYDEVLVNVIATPEGIAGLVRDFVVSGDILEFIANKIIDDLSSAAENIAEGRIDKTIQDLDTFKHNVDKERDKENISEEVATILLGAADATIGNL